MMRFKPIDEAALSRLFYALQGVGSGAEARPLTEAQETQRLKGQALREVAEAKEQEKLDQLARLLGLRVHPDISEADSERLYRALAS